MLKGRLILQFIIQNLLSMAVVYMDNSDKESYKIFIVFLFVFFVFWSQHFELILIGIITTRSNKNVFILSATDLTKPTYMQTIHY